MTPENVNNLIGLAAWVAFLAMIIFLVWRGKL